MQRQCFEDILDQEFEKMPSHADLAGRLKVNVLRRRLSEGEYHTEQKMQPFMELVQEDSSAARKIRWNWSGLLTGCTIR